MSIDFSGFSFLLDEYKSIKNIPIDVLKKLDGNVIMSFTDEQKNIYADVAVEYWNRNGFPYQFPSLQKIEKDFHSLQKLNVNTIFNKKEKAITQNMLGLGIANSYHPHKYSVKNKNNRTPVDNFYDKSRLKKCILKIINLQGDGVFRNSTVLKILSNYSGTCSVSNFRPTVAKYIYETYCPENGKVLDPSAGYSGRLLGALSSHIGEYEACDPCVDTYKGGIALYDTIKKINKTNTISEFIEQDSLPEVKLNNIPFEEYIPKPEYFDLVFTSPPYFSTEKYSDEPTQSYLRYPEYDQWLECFLEPLIKTSHISLKKNGYLILNIYGKIGNRCLEEDTLRIANKYFGEPAETLKLLLSKVMGIKSTGKIKDRNDNYKHKIEPIFIFKK